MPISNHHAKSEEREPRCRRTAQTAASELGGPSAIRLPPHGSAAVDPGSDRCAGPALPAGNNPALWRLQKARYPIP